MYKFFKNFSFYMAFLKIFPGSSVFDMYCIYRVYYNSIYYVYYLLLFACHMSLRCCDAR